MKHLRNIAVIMMIAVVSVFMMASCGNDTQSQLEETEAVHSTETTVTTESDHPDIGEEKVKSIVLAKVPGAVEANIYEFEREYDDGMIEYEGSLYHDGYEYEFEVDGATGKILQWEIDD